MAGALAAPAGFTGEFMDTTEETGEAARSAEELARDAETLVK